MKKPRNIFILFTSKVIKDILLQIVFLRRCRSQTVNIKFFFPFFHGNHLLCACLGLSHSFICFGIEPFTAHIKSILFIGIIGILQRSEIIFLCQLRSHLCKCFGNRTSAFLGTNSRTAAVPFGYMKSPEDPKQWIIEEPAAKIVRYIFELCIAGLGPMQIARRLEDEKVVCPTEYYYSIGRKTSNKRPVNPYKWDQATVVHILENR